MNIIIIGGSGFIGTNLIKQLKDKYSIGNIDKANSENFSSITITADIRDQNKLLNAVNPAEWLVLLAAEHRDDVSPVGLYYDVNVEGTKNVLAVMKERNINKIIFTSKVSFKPI